MATPVDDKTVAVPLAAPGEPVAAPPAAPAEPVAARSWPWGPPLALLLALVLPVVVLLQGPSPSVDLALVLQLVLCAYTGARLAGVVSSPSISPLQGMFWLFCYTAMGIAPLAQLVVRRTPIPVTGSADDIVYGLLLTLLGCLAFDVGTRLHSGKRGAGTGKVIDAASRPLLDIPRGRTIALTVLALVASAALVSTLGVGAFFSSRQAIGEGFTAAGLSPDSQAGTATLRAFGTVPVLLAFLVLTRRLVVDPRARRRPAFVLVWAVTLAAQVVVNNPISNARFWFVTVALSTALVLFPRRVGVFRALLLVGVAASLVLLPVADRFRLEGGQPTFERTSTVETLALKDYDQMNMMANTVTFVREGPGHTWGEQAAGTLLFWVPRSVWESKPIDTGTTVGLYLGTVNVNLSEPLWAELWIDFGLVGMLLGFVLVGYALRRADRWYAGAVMRGRLVTTTGLIAVPVLAGYESILLRGSLLQAMGRVGVMVLCFVLLSAWTRRRGVPEDPVPASLAPVRQPRLP